MNRPSLNATFFHNYYATELYPTTPYYGGNPHYFLRPTRMIYHHQQAPIPPSPEAATTSLLKTNPLLAVSICFLVIGMIVATVVGNAMVCLAVLLVRKLKQQPANLLLVSLAVADFCVGLLVMPPALTALIEDRWVLGDVVCYLWTSADLTLCTASILNLCMISVDRYLAVTRALRYTAVRTRKRMFAYIAIVWIVALLVSTAPLVVLPLKHVEKSCQISQNPLYQIYATMLAFYIPCFIMVTLYIRMWRAAKRLHERDRMTAKWALTFKNDQCSGDSVKSKKSTSLIPSPRKFHRPSALLNAVRMPLFTYIQSRPHLLGEDKARKTLGVIMSVFIICWLPFFILALVKSQYVTNTPQWLDTLVLWLGYFNSMLNPLIYCKYNREFRVPFREMLCCRFRTIQVVIRHESFHNKFGPPRIAGTHSGRRATQANGLVGTDEGHEHNNNLTNNNDIIIDEDEEYQI